MYSLGEGGWCFYNATIALCIVDHPSITWCTGGAISGAAWRNVYSLRRKGSCYLLLCVTQCDQSTLDHSHENIDHRRGWVNCGDLVLTPQLLYAHLASYNVILPFCDIRFAGYKLVFWLTKDLNCNSSGQDTINSRGSYSWTVMLNLDGSQAFM